MMTNNNTFPVAGYVTAEKYYADLQEFLIDEATDEELSALEHRIAVKAEARGMDHPREEYWRYTLPQIEAYIEGRKGGCSECLALAKRYGWDTP